jgi:hypothetical protein
MPGTRHEPHFDSTADLPRPAGAPVAPAAGRSPCLTEVADRERLRAPVPPQREPAARFEERRFNAGSRNATPCSSEKAPPCDSSTRTLPWRSGTLPGGRGLHGLPCRLLADVGRLPALLRSRYADARKTAPSSVRSARSPWRSVLRHSAPHATRAPAPMSTREPDDSPRRPTRAPTRAPPYREATPPTPHPAGRQQRRSRPAVGGAAKCRGFVRRNGERGVRTANQVDMSPKQSAYLLRARTSTWPTAATSHSATCTPPHTTGRSPRSGRIIKTPRCSSTTSEVGVPCEQPDHPFDQRERGAQPLVVARALGPAGTGTGRPVAGRRSAATWPRCAPAPRLGHGQADELRVARSGGRPHQRSVTNSSSIFTYSAVMRVSMSVFTHRSSRPSPCL